MQPPQPSASLVSQGFSIRVVLPAYAEKGKPLILAEAPGATEDKTGLVLHPEAEAGGLFTRLLARVGLQRERFVLTNCVWQRPPHNEMYDDEGYPKAYTHEAINYWKPYLLDFIQEMQPSVIIGLGRTALEVLTGFTDITTTRGYVHWSRLEISKRDDEWDLGGDPFNKVNLNIPCTCTYHPQFLNYGNRHLSGVFIRDVLAGVELGEKGWCPPKLNVTPTPTPEQFDWFCRQYNPDCHILTYDIENPETRGIDEEAIESELGKKEISYEVDRLSFCFRSDIGGYSVPYQEPYIGMAKRLVESARVLRGHNCRLHDRPRLVSHGFRFNGREEDTLELWRHLHRTLPASVAYIAPFYLNMQPWKHEAHTQPEWYSCLFKDQQVILWNGTSMKISKIVNERLRLRLLGMDEEGRRIPVWVEDWHKSPDTKNWVILRTRQKATLHCTVDHKVWTRFGWRRADEMHVGDEVVLPRYGSNSFIHGKLLGDGSISKINGLCMSHSPKQIKWLERCAYHMGVVPEDNVQVNGWGETRRAVAQVQSHWRHTFYPQGTKIFIAPPDDKALAVWYCDDGTLTNKHRPWTSQAAEFAIPLGMTEARTWFISKFGEGNLHIRPHIKAKAYYVTINRGAKRLFFEAIAPFVPPEMYYKLPLPYRNHYNGWMEQREFQWDTIKSIRGSKAGSSRYCVTVDHPTHRFFTRGGLVKNCMDAVCQHHIGEGIERDLRSTDQWEIAQRHVVDVLALTEQMSRNGLPYDANKAREFQVELEGKLKERLERLQVLVPDDLKPVKQKEGLKSGRTVIDKHSIKLPPIDVTTTTCDIDNHHFVVRTFTLWKDGLPHKERRWALLLPFNPESVPQKLNLIHHFGHKAKTDRKTKGESTGDATMKALVMKYVGSKNAQEMIAVECYQLIRECTSLGTIIGFLKGWKPSSDGLLHATPGIWGDMFRLTWRNPPLAATPSDKKTDITLAAGFRRSICVPDDQVIIESDWRSQEAVILGWYAKDQDYIRIANLSLNAYMCSHLLERPADLNWSDSDLRDYLRDIREDDRNVKVYDDAKHTIYLIQNGGTPFLIHQTYELPLARATYLFNFYFELFPKIKRFHQQTLQTAYETCRLVNKWNYRMPTWDTYTWVQSRYDKLRKLWVRFKTQPIINQFWTKDEKKWLERIQGAVSLKFNGSSEGEDKAIRSLCYDLGSSAKPALSFFPRDTGSAMLKDALLALDDEYGLVRDGYLRASAHDSIVAVAKIGEAERVAGCLKEVQERPVPQLDDLVIYCDQKFGQNWDKKAMKPMRLFRQMEAMIHV